MKANFLFVAAAALLVMNQPAYSQAYTVYPGSGAGTPGPSSTYTPRDDWRAQRNDWRKDSITDWRMHRNDWNDNYSKEYERKEYSKDRRFGDDCRASTSQPPIAPTNTETNNLTNPRCR
jgi:hypothetical protein